MSQVDNRNSSAAKRARTDGSRREDDWTCPSCGNVNFSFRTTCNMRNCTQPRPADHIAVTLNLIALILLST
uniref:RanBP2-type domain-containing protein n=1 Tax=Rhizophora mucronata TaxID=61149 RepID=A0A2P2LUC9_RHIMU